MAAGAVHLSRAAADPSRGVWRREYSVDCAGWFLSYMSKKFFYWQGVQKLTNCRSKATIGVMEVRDTECLDEGQYMEHETNSY